MMKCLTGLLCLLALATPLWGQANREVVQRGKAATALVELGKDKQTASAVCVHSSGIFITNYHVVKDVADVGTVRLVLHPNEESQREVKAKVVRRDEVLDLAVLKVEEGQDFTALPLGDDAELYETMSVTAFGFPFGKSLAVKENTLPDISINVGRITALRKREGALHQIQIDAQLNPGNSGGPLIDETGKIIGIVTKGVFATGVNFATPVSGVKQLLQRPEITFLPPKLTAANVHDEMEFQVRVVSFSQELKHVSVEMDLTIDKGPPRKFIATPSGNELYVIKAVPRPRGQQAPPRRIVARMSFASGNMTGIIEDREFKISGTTLRLADVEVMDLDRTWNIKLQQGKTATGTPEGLSDVSVQFGSFAVKVDLRHASSVHLQPLPQDESQLTYSLVVRSAEQKLHESIGWLRTSDGTSQPRPGMSVPWTTYRGRQQVLEVPSKVADACLGKGGQYLLLYLKNARKIAVYDANEAKIIKHLSIAADDALMAASLDKLVVVSPRNNVIEIWSLDTLERERTETLSVGVVKAIALGYASHGPLLIHSAAGTDALSQASYAFYDLKTLQPLPIENVRANNTRYRDVVHLRASATGDVFGVWASGRSPQGMETMVLDGNHVTTTYQHKSADYVVPTYDGAVIATGSAGLHTSDLSEESQRGEQNRPLIPSTHPRFILALPEPNYAGIDDPLQTRAVVRVVDSVQYLARLPELELGKLDSAAASQTPSDFTLDKRVFYIHQIGQVVSIPYTNDRLIVQPFDLQKSLVDIHNYLIVLSTPPVWFEKGTTFRYSMQAMARRGAVEMKLASGPPGMTMIGREITWEVPASFPEESVNVVVDVASSQGQRIRHVFKLRPRLKK